MKHKISQSLVFFSAGVTLIVGGVGTYHMIFTEKTAFPHLTLGISSQIPTGSLLGDTPYTIPETRGAENRVRARSPAFQSESTQLELKRK